MTRSLLLAAIAAAPAALAAVPADAVTSWPGFGAPLSATYSGYVTIPGGKHLHYVYVDAMAPANPATAPLALWLNGGPGCSSLEGMLQEGGPLWTAPGGETLALNNYTTGRFANLLYLEAPACVGFSYSDTQAGCTHDDTSTANDNLAALKAWFALYPERATNDFWITGESYAGIYIPMLAHAVWQSNTAGNSTIPLKGILVGNGCIGERAGICGNELYGDYLQLLQLYGHGFISNRTWAAAMAACGTWQTQTQACRTAANAAAREADSGVDDVYDIYNGMWGVCDYGNLVSPPPPKRKSSKPRYPRRPIRPGSIGAMFKATANGCTTDQDLNDYLNTAAVQTALHVRAKYWDVCGGIRYTHSMADERTQIYPDLIQQAKIKVVIFNGEADACVPITDNEWWTQSMGYPMTTNWQAWRAPDGSTGGYVTEYNTNGGGPFVFITIRGAGHMVQQTQPVYGYQVFRNAILGLPWGN